jgi:hypothetical protein
MQDKVLAKLLRRVKARSEAGDTVGAAELWEDIEEHLEANSVSKADRHEVDEAEQDTTVPDGTETEAEVLGDELPDTESEPEPPDTEPEPSHKFFRQTKIQKRVGK